MDTHVENTPLLVPRDETASLEIHVGNEYGLHARPAAQLAQAAQRFTSEVRLMLGGNVVDAKSIVDILTLAAAKGSKLTIEARGSDAAAAVSELALLFHDHFGEIP